jgi:hypothetical protein
MCQGAVRRLCDIFPRWHVRKVASLLARPLIESNKANRKAPAYSEFIGDSLAPVLMSARCSFK